MEASTKRVAEAKEHSSRVSGDLRVTEDRLAREQEHLAALSAEIFQAEESWETERVNHLELVEVMQAEYEAARKRLNSLRKDPEWAEVAAWMENHQLKLEQEWIAWNLYAGQ